MCAGAQYHVLISSLKVVNYYSNFVPSNELKQTTTNNMLIKTQHFDLTHFK